MSKEPQQAQPPLSQPAAEPKPSTYRESVVPGMYEIKFSDQNQDSKHFTDEHKAGATFYAIKRELMPRLIQHETSVSENIKKPDDRVETHHERLIAITGIGPTPGSYEHIFLDPSPKFRAGYEEAMRLQPEKAIPVADWSNADPKDMPKAVLPSIPQQPEKGRDMSEQHDSTTTAPLKIDGQDIKRLSIEKFTTPSGPEFKVRAFGAGKLPLTEYPAMPKDKLAHRLGQHIADAAQAMKGRKRILTPHDLPAPAWQNMKFFKHVVNDQTPAGQMAREAAGLPQQAAQPLSSPAPQPKMDVGQTVANTIELATDMVQHKAPPVDKADPAKAPIREQLRTSLAERFEVASIGTTLKPADEYRFKGDGPLRIAFTDHGKQLSSTLDTKEVVKGMADLAQAKGWREIVANGTPEFKRSIWMEGSLRGIHVAGFSPSKEDHERLKAAREQLAQQRQLQPAAAPQRPVNTVKAAKAPQPEKAPEKQAQQQAAAPAKAGPGQASPGQAPVTTREQWLAVTRSVLTEQGLPADKVDHAVKRMGGKVDALLASGGKLPALHVYDNKAPSLAPTPTATPQMQPAMQPGREHVSPGP